MYYTVDQTKVRLTSDVMVWESMDLSIAFPNNLRRWQLHALSRSFFMVVSTFMKEIIACDNG